MRSLFFIAVLLVTSSLLGQDKVILKGEVTTTEATEVILQHNLDYLGLKPIADTVMIENGRFEAEMLLESAAELDLFVGDKYMTIYAEPGDQMAVTFVLDTAIIDVKFLGDRAAENNFLFAFNTEFEESYNDTKMKAKSLEELIDVFEMDLFAQNKKQTKFLEGHADKGVFSKSFKNYVLHNIRYNYLHRLMAYPILRGNKAQTKTTVDALPRVMMDVVKPEWINNDEAMISKAYRGFVDYYVVYKASELNDFKKFQGQSQSVEKKYFYARQSLEGEAFNYFLAKWLVNKYQVVKPSTLRFLYGALEDTDLDKKYALKVKERIGTRLEEEDTEEELAAAEAPAPTNDNAMFVDEAGNAISLDDYKGKVIYVDFWASWCGPCRAQMPASKKLHDALSKKQQKKVVFLYISIDDSREKWLGAVEQMQIEGNHLWSKGGWGSKACQMFRINSIPRYMLIDKDGVIVNQKAPRPSQPEALQEILELL